jgi:RNA polymerase sigma factor (sigma-70 family)
MHDTKLKGLIRCLSTIAGGRPAAGLTDRQLLMEFSACADQTAFAALVERHAPMVLRVCRRVLRQEQDAEDAFQATFLVLAKKAATIRKTEALASWLHGVAYRVALRAKRDAGRWHRHEREAQLMSTKASTGEADWREVQATLDEEIQALPEKYRAPFVLCFLEGKGRAEVARELGLKEGTVWNRVSRARKLLQERLGRRGIALPALLAAGALSEGMARAAPRRLICSTLQAVSGQAARAGAVSARVAALAKGVSETMPMTKMKTMALFLTVTGLVAFGAGTALKGNTSTQPPVTGPAESPRLAAAIPGPAGDKAVADRSPESAIEEAGETVTFKARVLDPDGKPLTGAEITLWERFGYEGYYRAWHPDSAGPFRPKTLTRSGEDGRFTATFRKSEVTQNPFGMLDRPWRHVEVVAAAKGYGPAWAATLEGLDKGELTLRLVKDDVPVKGRVLDLEGRPVAGAAVRVVRVTVGKEVYRSLWQPSWEGLTGDVTTDREGRFTLSGVGRGRSVLLSIEGSSIEHKLILAKTPAAGDGPVAGSEVEVVVGPTKPVEGTVVAKGSGKALAGVVVYGEEAAHQRRVRALTDERGRYRLAGLPKAKAYTVTVYSPLDMGYLGTSLKVADTEGLRPVAADFELRHGVEVRCRLIDKVTRKPVGGVLRYSPLGTNPLYIEAELEPGGLPTREYQRLHVPAPDGVFRLVAYPGLGILLCDPHEYYGDTTRHYLSARLDAADKAKAQGDSQLENLPLMSCGYRLIDPKEGDKPLSIDIELDPGRKVVGSLIGPDGKAVAGATSHGLNYLPRDSWKKQDEFLKADTFTATLLDPEHPRTVSFVHKDRKLVGHAVLRGDEKGPVAVRLEPWGVLTGRLVDGGGKPVAGVRLGWRYPSLPAPGLGSPTAMFTTDAEGRFRVEGLTPGAKFEITLTGGAKKDTAFSGGEALKGLAIEPGQTKDLGEIRVKATPAPMKAEEGDEEALTDLTLQAGQTKGLGDIRPAPKQAEGGANE